MLVDAQNIPYRFFVAGYIYSKAQLYDPGAIGSYWTRTALNIYRAYSVNFHSTTFNAGAAQSDRYGGFFVRCITEPAS